MAWLCIHCGTQIYGQADKCPNCEKNPYQLEPGESSTRNPLRPSAPTIKDHRIKGELTEQKK